jgi:hypothetical protein
MKSNVAGKNISNVEIANISANGIWLLAKEREYFLPFDDFPWFKDANIGAILDVKLLHSHHLHWPQLDVDIDINSLGNLENYPLISKGNR